MTRSVFSTTESGQRIHVLLSSGYYFAQVRRMGYQKYESVGGRFKTCENAIIGAARMMRGKHRLRVIFQDSNPYYGPRLVFEGIRK